jgi:hypothetical protein
MNRFGEHKKVALIGGALAIMALMVPVSSPAVPNQCGGPYTGSGSSCQLALEGVTFIIYGYSDGSVSVHLRDPLGRSIASCTGMYNCNASNSVVGGVSYLHYPDQLGVFTCEVAGIGPGSYACVTYFA